MAWTAASVFELRPDGNTLNGMGFDAAFGGTDYSQQTTAQVSVSDGVTNGTTTVTSATANFTAAMVGNGINIASDSLYQITAVTNATTITVDRATANGGAGRSMKVGGAGTVAANGVDPVHYGVLVNGHKVWMRATNAAGTDTDYTPTTPAFSFSASQTNPVTFEGYSTTRGDGGRAKFSVATGTAVSGNFTVLRNLESIDTTGTSVCFSVTGSECWIENIVCTPSTSGGDTFDAGGSNNTFRRITTNANTTAGGGSHAVSQSGTNNRFEFCDLGKSASLSGINLNSAAVFRYCIIRDNANHGIRYNLASTQAAFYGCIIWNNTDDGVEFLQAADGITGSVFENCIFGKNGGYDLNYTLADISTNPGAQQYVNAAWECNFFYTTGTGRYHFLPAASGDTALTANPFTSDTTGDFSLNSTAGGGAVITATPCTVSFSDGQNSSSLLAGFYGTTPATSSTVTMRNLWRELTNQRDSIVVPDSVVDIYLDWGIQHFQRMTRFNVVTDSTSVTLVAGTQEYTMPTDSAEIVFVQYGSNRLLEKGSVEQWRRLGEDWRNEPQGEPRFWAHYGGNHFVIRPAPSAEAVATAPNLTIRSKQTPGTITTNGTGQLPSLYWRLVVMYGAFLWSSCYPDSVLAQQRAAALKAEYDAGLAAAIEDFARKDVSL